MWVSEKSVDVGSKVKDCVCGGSNVQEDACGKVKAEIRLEIKTFSIQIYNTQALFTNLHIFCTNLLYTGTRY